MPVAAVPYYIPDRALAGASPGLRFGMYLKLWGVDQRSKSLLWDTRDIVYRVTGRDHRERAIPEDTKSSALDAACRITPSDHAMMRALAQRQQALAQALERSGALLTLKADAVAPFTTGLGNEHPLENGFAFLNPYGLPYLPGSGVKGVVRQAASELASGDWGDPKDWNLDGSYPLRIGKDEVGLSLLDVLFGRETASGETQHVRGALSFWDVFPEIDGERLIVEVMTPHQGHYYQKGETPHDSGSPNPITFLTVPPRSRFAFHVLCHLEHLRRLAPSLAEADRWKRLVEAAFQHAFEWLGFGAKTSVGYGAFQLAARSDGGKGEMPAPVSAAKLDAPETHAGSETVWDRARLQFNAQNGRLTAAGPNNATAYADAPRGAEIFSSLPTEVQRRVRTNPYSVRFVARVRGSELISVEFKP